VQELATVAAPTSPAAEAYRTVAVNLRFAGEEPRPKTILFTSGTSSDGKTAAIANVAVAAAQANARVVLVDGDLHRPSLHQIFGVANTQGLSTLRGAGALETVVHDTDIEGLKLVTSGPMLPNPSEVLSSSVVAEFIARLRSDADLVLVDAAPVTAAVDTSLLAQHSTASSWSSTGGGRGGRTRSVRRSNWSGSTLEFSACSYTMPAWTPRARRRRPTTNEGRCPRRRLRKSALSADPNHE